MRDARSNKDAIVVKMGVKLARAQKAKAKSGATEPVEARSEAKPEASALDAAPSAVDQAAEQQTRISASRGMVDFLANNRLSFAVTSYQTGQLMLVGAMAGGRLSVFQRNFVRAMGLWASSQTIYVSSIAQLWRLENVLGPQQIANQHFDRLYVPRTAQTTGDIDMHEIGVMADGQVVFVNTKYSCLAMVDATHSFRPVWKPKFISKLAPEDRCHLNGLAMKDGKPKFVTAVSRSDVVDGWRERRGEGGVIVDVDTDRIVTEDLSMPHSPRLVDGKLYVLDSGRGNLCRVDEKTGKHEAIAFCPGFLRGLSFWRGYALVATSLPRDGTFKGLQLDQEIAARDGEARCGVFVIDVKNGDILHWVRFDGLVRELFEATFLPGVRTPMCVGLASPEMRTLITLPDDAAPAAPELKTAAPAS
jgi:uncharacterized protein (TIGR03032 family)